MCSLFTGDVGHTSVYWVQSWADDSAADGAGDGDGDADSDSDDDSHATKALSQVGWLCQCQCSNKDKVVHWPKLPQTHGFYKVQSFHGITLLLLKYRFAKRFSSEQTHKQIIKQGIKQVFK